MYSDYRSTVYLLHSHTHKHMYTSAFIKMCISKQKKEVYSEYHLRDLRPNLGSVLKDMKTAMGRRAEEYSELKQSLSTYLPQHLLTTSPVPQEIDK